MDNIIFVPGEFLSTLSLRRATVYALKLADAMLFLSTLSLRRATARIHVEVWLHEISIHALLAESDYAGALKRPDFGVISIHALLAESDAGGSLYPRFHRHFYPRSPCGERQPPGWHSSSWIIISIHALLAESDSFALFFRFRRGISIHALLAESDCDCTPKR